MLFSKIKCKKDVENIETGGEGRKSSQRNKHTVVEMGNKMDYKLFHGNGRWIAFRVRPLEC